MWVLTHYHMGLSYLCNSFNDMFVLKRVTCLIRLCKANNHLLDYYCLNFFCACFYNNCIV